MVQGTIVLHAGAPVSCVYMEAWW